MTNLEQEVKSRVSRLNEMDEEAKAHSASSKTLEEELIAWYRYILTGVTTSTLSYEFHGW